MINFGAQVNKQHNPAPNETLIEIFFAKYLINVIEHPATISANHDYYAKILGDLRNWCLVQLECRNVPQTNSKFFPDKKQPIVLPSHFPSALENSNIIERLPFDHYHKLRENHIGTTYRYLVYPLLTPAFSKHFDVNLKNGDEDIHWLIFPDHEEFIQATTVFISSPEAQSKEHITMDIALARGDKSY